MICVLMNNQGIISDLTKNPFYFHHYNVSDLAVLISSKECSIKSIKLNYGSGQYIMAYRSFFDGLGKINQDEGININRFEYAQGYTIYAFDFTPDPAVNECFNFIKNGSLRVDITLSTAIPEAVSLITCTEFEYIIEIGHNRNVV
jgi:hypothetical protein